MTNDEAWDEANRRYGERNFELHYDSTKYVTHHVYWWGQDGKKQTGAGANWEEAFAGAGTKGK